MNNSLGLVVPILVPYVVPLPTPGTPPYPPGGGVGVGGTPGGTSPHGTHDLRVFAAPQSLRRPVVGLTPQDRVFDYIVQWHPPYCLR